MPFPPGGAPDIVARILGNKLTEQLGQPVIVDPRPGGSGVIAAEIAKNAPPDGYTLLLAGSTLFAALPALKPKLPYDTDKDFVALSRVASVANVVAVHPSLGVGTVADLVKLAKARPGQLNYGSGGNGSASHLAGEMFNVLAGVKTVHVPYKGAVLALNDLIAGQLQFIMTSPVSRDAPREGGRIKVIATTGAKRDPLLPDLPTVADVRSRLRDHAVVGCCGAGENARRHREKAARRDRESAAIARSAGAARQTGRHGARRVSSRVHRLHQGRTRAHRARRPAGRHHARLGIQPSSRRIPDSISGVERMNRKIETGVLIVGAGPVGLTLPWISPGAASMSPSPSFASRRAAERQVQPDFGPLHGNLPPPRRCQKLREVGLPADYPNDIVSRTTSDRDRALTRHDPVASRAIHRG